MKKFITLLALVATLTLTACGSGGGVQTLGPQDFLSAAAKPGAVVLDVRTAQEYASGHVDGAINIDVEAADFENRVAQLDKSTTYLVYCHSGRRSTLATTALAKDGFGHVDNLSGGIADLVAAGATLATT